MRPALLRLLKRPSTLSILDTLASTPVGIEQLKSRYTCLQCQSRGIQQESPVDDRSRETDRAESTCSPRKTNHRGTVHSVTKALKLRPEKLEFESDVGHANDIGTRLVDLPENSNDFELWEELLRFRQRHYGDKGIVDIWEGLTVRVEGVRLPTAGERADFFWKSFVDLGLKRELFLKDVVKYAVKLWEQTGDRWPQLYESVVGGLLDRGKMEQAVEYHKSLQRSHLDQPNDLVQILEWAIRPLSRPVTSGLHMLVADRGQHAVSPGVKAFQKMCSTIVGHRIYGRVVSTLLRHGFGEDAIRMHHFLVHREDHPQTYEEMQPVLDYYARRYGRKKGFKWLKAYARQRFASRTPSIEVETPQASPPKISNGDYSRQRFASETPSIDKERTQASPPKVSEVDYTQQGLASETPSIDEERTQTLPPKISDDDLSMKKPFREDFRAKLLASKTPPIDVETPLVDDLSENKPFRDDFAARLFATWAFSFETVLVGLQMFGVTAIGPSTLREMAVRAHGSRDVSNKLKELQKSGISVVDCVFSRLIQKLASQNRDILLSDLLQSDQHPDVMEDVRVQESLLVSYYKARDSRQYNLTLAVLMELSPDAPDLFDIHFRKHIATGELTMASRIVEKLALRQKTLSEDSIDFMAEQVLSPRRMNNRPVMRQRLSPLDEVMFVFRILQRVVPTGAYVSAAFWVEILKRLGMGNYWNQLRECCLWLVRQYGRPPAESPEPWALSQPTDLRLPPAILDHIFTPRMQGAIVAWGFLLRVSPKHDALGSETSETFIPWVRGILLLRELERAGLRLNRRWIRRASRQRLAVLFSQFVPSARLMNRLVRRENPFSVQRVIGDVIRAWGEPSLFDGMESDPTRLVNPGRSPKSWWRSMNIRLPRRRVR